MPRTPEEQQLDDAFDDVEGEEARQAANGFDERAHDALDDDDIAVQGQRDEDEDGDGLSEVEAEELD